MNIIHNFNHKYKFMILEILLFLLVHDQFKNKTLKKYFLKKYNEQNKS